MSRGRRRLGSAHRAARPLEHLSSPPTRWRSCFFFPVFVFRSPFAAVSGMVIAHGLQYLWVQGAMARGPRDRYGGSDRAVPGRAARIAVLACVAVSGGAVLNALSGLHASSVTGARALYGVYLGIVMAHFVIDAVVWRSETTMPVGSSRLGSRSWS